MRIEALGPPDRIIAGFHPELFGVPLDEEDGVIRTDVIKKGDLTYYQWCDTMQRLPVRYQMTCCCAACAVSVAAGLGRRPVRCHGSALCALFRL